MTRIKIFGYTNKEGISSWKVVLLTGENADYFGGISLGKALLSENATSDFDGIINAGVAYEMLDHLPRKGEGLPAFNDCYKMFKKSSVSYTLAEIPASQVIDDIQGFKNAVAAIKQCPPEQIQQTVKDKKPAPDMDRTVIDAILFLNDISDVNKNIGVELAEIYNDSGSSSGSGSIGGGASGGFAGFGGGAAVGGRGFSDEDREECDKQADNMSIVENYLRSLRRQGIVVPKEVAKAASEVRSYLIGLC